MSTFKHFADAVNAKFLEMSKTGALFTVNISNDTLWSAYQNAFAPKDNMIFRERPIHDCQTCRSFIKRIGTVVVINDDYSLDTIWNVTDIPAPYDHVARVLHDLVSSATISSPFVTSERLAGREYNLEETATGPIRWDHFYADIDAAFVPEFPGSVIGGIETSVSLFKRALDEFSPDTLTMAADLCTSIYRGEEFLSSITKFSEASAAYLASQQHPHFAWKHFRHYPARIRNSAIGTLLVDIASGLELEDAVAKYEKIVAPENYKRTTAVVTPRMKADAIRTIDKLDLRDSLPRRHAVLEDISVSDVLFASADAQSVMQDPLLEAMGGHDRTATIPSTAIDISIEKFLSDVLPHSTTVEALVENRHTPNFVSLVAPVHPDALSIFKWDNNFSWSYNGEVADAMKERVKAAGGSVDGVLRCSIQWNEEFKDTINDLDLHCTVTNHHRHIYFGDKQNILDVDIRRPGMKVAVENMIWQSVPRDGQYTFFVTNFAGRNSKGFRAQIEFNGQIFDYDYSSSVTRDVPIAVVTIANGKISIEHNLESSQSSKQIWDVTTLQYQPISTIMLSPNHWGDQHIGNKHYFFMLDGCHNPDNVRGFYNEFLHENLRPHRKVFEVLSSNMKCEPTDKQLSGLGFSSTIKNDLYVRVDGRPYHIQF